MHLDSNIDLPASVPCYPIRSVEVSSLYVDFRSSSDACLSQYHRFRPRRVGPGSCGRILARSNRFEWQLAEGKTNELSTRHRARVATGRTPLKVTSEQGPWTQAMPLQMRKGKDASVIIPLDVSDSYDERFDNGTHQDRRSRQTAGT